MKNRLHGLFVCTLSAALLLSSCGTAGQAGGEPSGQASAKPAASTAPAKPAESSTAPAPKGDLSKLWQPAPSLATYQTGEGLGIDEDTYDGIYSLQNGFHLLSAKLLEKLPADKDQVLSPASLGLALVALGAAQDEPQRQELLKFFSEDKPLKQYSQLTNGIGLLQRKWMRDGSKLPLNSQFFALGANDQKWSDDYLKLAQSVYNLQAALVDYHQGEALKDQINKLISEETDGRINPFLQEPLSPDSLYTLLQILTFRGEWKFPFDKANTKEEIFHGRKGDTKVQMMHLENLKCSYVKSAKAEYLQVPYKGAYKAWLVLPLEGVSLRDAMIEATGGKEELDFAPASAELKLPRFDVKKTTKLLDLLPEMGLGGLLSKTKMSAFQGSPEGTLTELIQTVRITTDEVGTKADAVTMAGVEKSAMPAKPIPVKFIVDRPFGFIVLSQVPLFFAEISDLEPQVSK